MATVIAGMTVSLDGFVADREGQVSALYPDFEAFTHSDHMRETIANTGAVVMGRRTFAMADPDGYVGEYEFQVPIFVVTGEAPDVAPKQDENLTFTFVTDGVVAACDLARAAAGDKLVQVVGGASVIQQLLNAGLVDELHLDIIPVVLGGGLRLLENLDPARVRLEKKRVRELGGGPAWSFKCSSVA